MTDHTGLGDTHPEPPEVLHAPSQRSSPLSAFVGRVARKVYPLVPGDDPKQFFLGGDPNPSELIDHARGLLRDIGAYSDPYIQDKLMFLASLYQQQAIAELALKEFQAREKETAQLLDAWGPYGGDPKRAQP